MSRLLTKLLPTNLQGTSKAALKIRDHIPLMIALKTTIAKQLKTLMRTVIATEKQRRTSATDEAVGLKSTGH